MALEEEEEEEEEDTDKKLQINKWKSKYKVD